MSVAVAIAMSQKGVLWKWTNYWNGWQPRWFILEDGILSYYKSEEDVTQGCKGSVSVSACDINVHPTDNLRLDIVIPGEQHIYVRAASTTERQHWLVALGSTKAQGLDLRNRKTSESIATPDVIKTKKCELRLYCDLLMQQVHSMKEAANSSEGPDIKKLEESSGLFSVTCDTFIKTLEDCVSITSAAPAHLNSQPSHVIPVQAAGSTKSHQGRPRVSLQTSFSN